MRGACVLLLLTRGNGHGTSWACSAVIVVAVAVVGLYALKVRRDFAREDAERRQRRRSGRVHPAAPPLP